MLELKKEIKSTEGILPKHLKEGDIAILVSEYGNKPRETIIVHCSLGGVWALNKPQWGWDKRTVGMMERKDWLFRVLENGSELVVNNGN